MSLFESLKRLYKKADKEPEEQMVAIKVVYEPNTVDSDGNWASEEVVEQMCKSFNESLEAGKAKPNLFHLAETDMFEIAETWINKSLDVTVDASGEKVKAGTWLAKIQYKDADLWKAEKMGLIGGLSLGGVGTVNEKTGEILKVDFFKDLGESD